jgi:hypothetical protein
MALRKGFSSLLDIFGGGLRDWGSLEYQDQLRDETRFRADSRDFQNRVREEALTDDEIREFYTSAREKYPRSLEDIEQQELLALSGSLSEGERLQRAFEQPGVMWGDQSLVTEALKNVGLPVDEQQARGWQSQGVQRPGESRAPGTRVTPPTMRRRTQPPIQEGSMVGGPVRLNPRAEPGMSPGEFPSPSLPPQTVSQMPIDVSTIRKQDVPGVQRPAGVGGDTEPSSWGSLPGQAASRTTMGGLPEQHSPALDRALTYQRGRQEAQQQEARAVTDMDLEAREKQHEQRIRHLYGEGGERELEMEASIEQAMQMAQRLGPVEMQQRLAQMAQELDLQLDFSLQDAIQLSKLSYEELQRTLPQRLKETLMMAAAQADTKYAAAYDSVKKTWRLVPYGQGQGVFGQGPGWSGYGVGRAQPQLGPNEKIYPGDAMQVITQNMLLGFDAAGTPFESPYGGNNDESNVDEIINYLGNGDGGETPEPAQRTPRARIAADRQTRNREEQQFIETVLGSETIETTPRPGMPKARSTETEYSNVLPAYQAIATQLVPELKALLRNNPPPEVVEDWLAKRFTPEGIQAIKQLLP